MENFTLETLTELSRRFFALLDWAIFDGKWTVWFINLGLFLLWIAVHVIRAELKQRRATRDRR